MCLVAVDMTGSNSITVPFQEPKQWDSAICTKYRGNLYEWFHLYSQSHTEQANVRYVTPVCI
jgi:hypothetical protein